MPTAPTGVVFDARYLTAEPSGIGVVCMELLRGFARLPNAPRMRVLARPAPTLPAEVQGDSNLDIVEVPYSPYGGRNQLLLPGLLNRLGASLLHCPDCFSPVLARSVKMVVTVHDLIPLVCRKHLARSKKARLLLAWKAWVKWQCRRADAVAAVSRHSAAELTRLLGVPAEKVRVIHNPVRELRAAETREEYRRRLGLDGARIVSFVGRQDPYKNLLTLIRALPEVIRRLGEAVRLMVAGSPDPRYPEPHRETERLNLSGQVVFTGYLAEEDLASLYAASDVLVFPSLYEGFGLPPLEAMSLGTPVVASNRASIPEVLGDAALYVNPESPGELAAGIARVLIEPALAERLRQAGRARAAQFSAQRAAEEHLALYAEILGEGAPR